MDYYDDDIEIDIILELELSEDNIGYCYKWDSEFLKDTGEWLDYDCEYTQALGRPPRFPIMQVVVNNDRHDSMGRASSFNILGY